MVFSEGINKEHAADLLTYNVYIRNAHAINVITFVQHNDRRFAEQADLIRYKPLYVNCCAAYLNLSQHKFTHNCEMNQKKKINHF